MPSERVIDHRICVMNEIASTDTIGFTNLIRYAKSHPMIMESVLRQYVVSPDYRFGDTLIIFCSMVEHKQIDLA